MSERDLFDMGHFTVTLTTTDDDVAEAVTQARAWYEARVCPPSTVIFEGHGEGPIEPGTDDHQDCYDSMVAEMEENTYRDLVHQGQKLWRQAEEALTNLGLYQASCEVGEKDGDWFWWDSYAVPQEDVDGRLHQGPFRTEALAREALVRHMTQTMAYNGLWPEKAPMSDLIEFAEEHNWPVIPVE